MITNRIGFMFAGQGAQFSGMGRDIHQASAAARQVFAQADDCLQRPLSKLCFDGSEQELTDTATCQPAIYTMSIACLSFLQEKVGQPLTPACSAGLSLGEFAALHAASAISFRTGLNLLDQRGRLMAQACRTQRGAMAAVLNSDRKTTETICRECDIDIANYNCPGQLVISGRQDNLEKAITALRENGVSRIIPLSVAGAFHSRLMSPASREFAPMVEAAEMAPPSCPVLQNTSGQPVTSPAEIKRNLQKQVDHSVRWEECASEMIKKTDLLIEFGPGTVLSGFIRKINRGFPVFPAGTVEQVEKVAAAIQLS